MANAMSFAVAADHAGFPLKSVVISTLESLGHGCVDVGTYDTTPVDYPDVAEAVASRVASGEVDRGVLICGSGVGASIAANKIMGVRAALCHDTYSAHQGVEHDSMNVLCFGACVVGEEIAKELVRAFAGAIYDGAERHERRLRKVRALERRHHGQDEPHA